MARGTSAIDALPSASNCLCARAKHEVGTPRKRDAHDLVQGCERPGGADADVAGWIAEYPCGTRHERAESLRSRVGGRARHGHANPPRARIECQFYVSPEHCPRWTR